jgi:hypothetical protein
VSDELWLLCQWEGRWDRDGREVPGQEVCAATASHRVSIGIYGGGWALCAPHVGTLIERYYRTNRILPAHVSVLREEGGSRLIATVRPKLVTLWNTVTEW